MSGQPKQRFTARLVARGPHRAWTLLILPFRVREVWGTGARVPVSGTMNGVPFRSSAMPRSGGIHFVMASRGLREAAGAGAGDRVKVVIGVDRAVRSVRTPPALAAALRLDKAAARRYAAKSYSWRKEHVDYLRNAKRDATRQRRLALILRLLRAA